MYHYVESGLQNVWLRNGYTKVRTAYGTTVSIHDIEGLHAVIGRFITQRPRLTGAQLRFIRKELGLSQRTLGEFLGTSEQNVSLWERRGRMPKGPDRLLRLLYLEKLDGNVQVAQMIERLNKLDEQREKRLAFEEAGDGWALAA